MILLLGASGYVGQAFQRLLARQGLPYAALSRSDVDYGNPAELLRVLREMRPQFLINSAGYTGKPNVDACEVHKAECLLGNAVLPGRIAEACAAAGVPWGHVSSGCIFHGSRPDGSGFHEEDSPNFSFRSGYCSFYSGSKALGEEVLACFPDIYVWRLRIPFHHADNPRNYLTKLLRYERLLEATNSISELDEFASACLACWQKRVPAGIYHVTNPGIVTTREVVGLIQKSKVSAKEFRFFDDEEEFMRLAAKTPRSNCILDSSKLAAAGIVLTEVHEALERDLKNWVPSPP